MLVLADGRRVRTGSEEDMTTPGLNQADPVTDTDEIRIGPVDDSLPETPDHQDVVDEAEEPEPEDTEVPQ
jgi:hypothetical protein